MAYIRYVPFRGGSSGELSWQLARIAQGNNHATAAEGTSATQPEVTLQRGVSGPSSSIQLRYGNKSLASV